MSPNFANYDYELESQRIAKRRQLAEAMQLKSMELGNPQTDGSGTWAGALAKALQAYSGVKGQQNAQQEERELADRSKQDLVSGLEQYTRQMQGTPDAPGGSVPNITGEAPDGTFQTDGQLTVPGEKPNKRQAMIDAISSNHPVLRNLGMQGLAQMGKSDQELTQKDLLSLSGYDPKSRIAAALRRDPSLLAPETKEHVVGNQLVAGIPGGEYNVGFDGRERFGDVGPVARGPNGAPILGQRNNATGEVKFAPGGGTTVNVSTEKKASDAFGVGLAEARVKNLQASYENAQMAVKTLDSVREASKMLDAGIKSGASANVALGIAKWAQALGMDADPAVANTETFRASMAQQTLATVKALGAGTGISNADREFAEKAAGGSITLDDHTMQRLIDITKLAAANTLVGHKQLMDKNSRGSGAIPEDLRTLEVPFSIDDEGGKFDWNQSTGRLQLKPSAGWTPTVKKTSPQSARTQTPVGTAAKPMSLDQYLKSQGY